LVKRLVDKLQAQKPAATDGHLHAE
jgi:hypothetical protein